MLRDQLLGNEVFGARNHNPLNHPQDHGTCQRKDLGSLLSLCRSSTIEVLTQTVCVCVKFGHLEHHLGPPSEVLSSGINILEYLYNRINSCLPLTNEQQQANTNDACKMTKAPVTEEIIVAVYIYIYILYTYVPPIRI